MKEYLEQSYHELKATCATWELFTTSYMLGRALSGEPNNNGMIQIAQDLLNNKKSPLKGQIYL